MELFIFGAITGVFLSLLPTIGGAVSDKVRDHRRVKLDSAVSKEIARREQLMSMDDPWNDSGWMGPRPGQFVPRIHP